MHTKMFGSVSQVLISTLVFLATGASASASAGTSVLLAFSSDRCGACQAMQPTLKELERSGVPMRHVNVNREPHFARRHGIRQTPTFVIWSAGKELTRLVGVQSAEQLQRALAVSDSGPLVRTGANVNRADFLNAPQTRLVGRQPANAVGEAMPSVSRAVAIERAQAATVRLRVHDGRGFGVGTGTVIDRHGEEALVLTCGHLFRETKMNSKVEVDLFVGGQVRTVPGQVVDYDAEDRDIALVAIKPGFEMVPVPVLPENERPQAGQTVFSFGCDHGDDPSRRDTRITGVNKYNQHIGSSNIEIAGAPVDGRSGGGLFNDTGVLVGVCNAADYKGDVGIYTGPGSVNWQLDRVQLSHLYQGSGGNSPSLNSPANQTPPQPAARLAANPFAVVPSAASRHPAGSNEMIVIVADPNAPGGKRVISVNQPTAELLSMIQRQGR